MSNKKYTAEQKQLIISLSKLKKTPKEISDIVGIPRDKIKGIVQAAKRDGKLEYNKKYYKFGKEETAPTPPITERDKLAKVYKGNYDSLSIPVIKFKTNQYQSIFDVRV